MAKLYHCYVDVSLRSSSSWPYNWRLADEPDQVDALIVNQESVPDWLWNFRRDNPVTPVVFVGQSPEPREFSVLPALSDDLLKILNGIESMVDALAQIPQLVRDKISSDPYVAMAAYLWSRGKRAELNLSLHYRLGYGYACAEAIPEAHQVLINMAHAGYLDQELAEAVHTCPACETLHVLLRDTCIDCGSISIREERLLHHFSCSYQGRESSFLDARGNYVCPKCRKQLRHIGMDYDKPGAVFMCRQCGHQSAETQIRGRCIACNHHFKIEQSARKEIYTYVLNQFGVHALFQGKFTATALEDILEPKPGLVAPEVMAMLMKKFAALEQRYGLKTSLLKVDFNEDVGINRPLEQRVKLITAVGQEVARLRSTDTVAYHLGQLLILLPGCDDKGLTRIISNFQALITDIFGTETAQQLRFTPHSVQDPLPLAA